MSMEREEYRNNLVKELREYQEDIELMSSHLWERMIRLFNIRREALMDLVMEDRGENMIDTQRLKGRYLEVDYFLTLAQYLREGADAALRRLDEMEIEELQEQAADTQGVIL